MCSPINERTSCLYEPPNFNIKYQTIASAIPPGSTVLDVGCATGFLGEYLSMSMNCHVTGIEMDPMAAEVAKDRCQRVIVGDITSPEVASQISDRYDVIVFADVLEHLQNPEKALALAHDWIAKDGRVLISLPNIAYYRIRLDLLRGKFEYQEQGILDCTHLKFFTEESAKQYIMACNFRAVEVKPIFINQRDRILGRIFPRLHAYVFVFLCEE